MPSKTRSTEDIDYDRVHRRLRRTREDLNLEVLEVGKDTGIGPQYLGALELNRTPGVWAHILKLAAYYGCTVDWLLGASWANNPERNVTAEWSEEALTAVSLVDSIGSRAGRQELLSVLESQAHAIKQLSELAVENIRLRLLLQEVTTASSPDEIVLSDSTIAEAIEKLLSRKRTDGD